MGHDGLDAHSDSDSDNENEGLSDCDKVPLLPTTAAANSTTVNLTSKELLLAAAPPPLTQNNYENRILHKLSVRLHKRFDYRRSSHCDKWLRIRLGILIISFVSVIYLCFSINLSLEKQSPQLIVDVPPMDDSLPGPRENNADGFQPNVLTFITTKSFQINANYNTTTTITTTTTTASYISTIDAQYPTNLPLSSSSSSLMHNNTFNQTVPNGFLVWSPGCQMPAMDPLAKDVMHLFHKEKYETCSSSEPLTRIEMNWTTSVATLIFDNTPKWYNAFLGASCCYSEISRSGSGKNADEHFKLSHCVDFQKTIELPLTVEYIFVKCQTHGKTVYKNTHAIIREKPPIRQRLNEFKEKYNKTRPLSVLMLSIDSISRLNLIRAMPITAQHLYKNGWFELQGYNKIDDNTYPNLMAILTGYNNSLAYNECAPRDVGKLEKCPFVWSGFQENGYVTSYGEDAASISTFNYRKTGFVKQPTDYYMRPYMLAAEKHLQIKRKHSLAFCLGYKHSADHIYDYAMDFATQYKNDPSFGLYWTNTFSHQDISDPSSMDCKMNAYLDVLKTRGILNESMVVFFSDHGIRFGPVRHLVTGWLEERLPFIFIWLPEWFRNEHPEIVQALKINRNRLTNPYDLHMTLKHVLELSNRGKSYAAAESCANCQSLFTEIPWNRSCEETSIAAHWCTCAPYKVVKNTNDEIVKKAAQFVIDHVNRDLQNYTHDDGKHRLCAELKMKTISYSRKAEYPDSDDPYDDYVIVFSVSPSNGWFESTVRFKVKKHEFEITGSVSRLDSYASQSTCMKIDYLRKYCYCTGNSSSKNKYKKG